MITRLAHVAAKDPEAVGLTEHAGQRAGVRMEQWIVGMAMPGCVDELPERFRVASPADGTISLRNSNHPDTGVVFFTRAEIAAWIKGCKAGEFDDLDT
ncbi:MAG: DUF397 domain-containing protein [Pseudonocardiaceae bacterium]